MDISEKSGKKFETFLFQFLFVMKIEDGTS